MTSEDEVPQVYPVDDPNTTPADPKETFLRQHFRLWFALLAATFLIIAVMAWWSVAPFPEDFEVRLVISSIAGLIALGIFLYLVVSSLKSVKRPRINLRGRKKAKSESHDELATEPPAEVVVEPARIESLHRVPTQEERRAAFARRVGEALPPDPFIEPPASAPWLTPTAPTPLFHREPVEADPSADSGEPAEPARPPVIPQHLIERAEAAKARAATPTPPLAPTPEPDPVATEVPVESDRSPRDIEDRAAQFTREGGMTFDEIMAKSRSGA